MPPIGEARTADTGSTNGWTRRDDVRTEVPDDETQDEQHRDGGSDVRVRRVDGALVYSVLQPHRSGGADQAIYSIDGVYLAVHNQSGGLGYRVHRASDGVFL